MAQPRSPIFVFFTTELSDDEMNFYYPVAYRAADQHSPIYFVYVSRFEGTDSFTSGDFFILNAVARFSTGSVFNFAGDDSSLSQVCL